MFAIITVALISGAVADRLKFGGWLVFAGLWATFVYFPVAHWVFAFDGFTGETRWLDRQQAQGNRLRRWYCGAHQLRCRRPGAVPRPRQAQGLAGHADAAAQPAVRDARCRSAVVRLVRVQRRFGASAPVAPPVRPSSPRRSPPPPRCWPGCSPRRSATVTPTIAGCGLGHRRRPGRDHAVLFVGERAWRTGDRRRSAVCSALWRSA